MPENGSGSIYLSKGNHPEPPADCDDPKRCLFEWYNWIVSQSHTDNRPPGVSIVIWKYGMDLNDILPDDRRQELIRFLPNGEDRLAGTANDGKDKIRSYIAIDWIIRTYTPKWLDLAGLTEEAATLRDLRRITDAIAARAAESVVCNAQEKAYSARNAAADSADAAAHTAAANAADSAYTAAYTAYTAAYTAYTAAYTAYTAASAAYTAAYTAASAAYTAAAARKDLAPTVTEMYDSAIALYDTLITGEWV